MHRGGRIVLDIIVGSKQGEQYGVIINHTFAAQMRLNKSYYYSWSLLVLLALITQTFRFNVVIADYYVNTANYIKNCINKSKPKSTCQGKCQMMKKMREEQQKEEQSSGNRTENKFEQVVYFNSISNNYTFPFLDNTKSFPPFSEGETQDFISSPFQPPGV